MSGPADFQPLLPDDRSIAPLLDLAGELVTSALGLGSVAGHGLIPALTPKLRAMNSYYSNRIEGQHTRPAEIERALEKDFDADKGLARKQRLAIAHIETEEELEREYQDAQPRSLFHPDVVLQIHRRLCDKLPKQDRRTDEGEPVEPGRLRQRDVAVGSHVAPRHEAVSGLLEHWGREYSRTAGRERLLVAMACSHHRLAWIHPFLDGNGRVARLHAHLLLHSMGLTRGLWSPMRGLARSVEQYYARLHSADLPRRNDLDGRGALSQEELVSFAGYFLTICLDQVKFLENRLSLSTLKDHIRNLLRHLSDDPWRIGSEKSVVKIEALEPLHYMALAGPIERARFVAMTGLGERTGRRVLASLLHYGLLESDSTRAPVRFALPLKALPFLFPGLWPEVETD